MGMKIIVLDALLPFKRWMVLTDILHCVAIRLVERPLRNPLRIANRSKRDSGSRLVVRLEQAASGNP